MAEFKTARRTGFPAGLVLSYPLSSGQYQTADNPIFEVFYLENPHGVIADFSGNPPYEF